MFPAEPYYLFFDTETTGLPNDYNASPNQLDNWPRIVQIAWLLHDCEGNEISKNEFIAKCESKGISQTDFQVKLAQRLPQYKGRWKASMADQIQNLPDFEQVEREVMRHLKSWCRI